MHRRACGGGQAEERCGLRGDVPRRGAGRSSLAVGCARVRTARPRRTSARIEPRNRHRAGPQLVDIHAYTGATGVLAQVRVRGAGCLTNLDATAFKTATAAVDARLN